MHHITAFIAVLFVTLQLKAATYYVDYDNGSDSQNGTSESTAWKHAPGDPAAAGNANMTPPAGTTILLKGGVHYKGKININFNGTSGSPITYKGDSWGTGKAVIDCSEPVTGWTRCTSADQAGGNSNFANIWVADAPAGVTALEANLFIGDSLAYVAQYPNQAEPYWMDARGTYLVASSISRTSLAGSELAAIGSDITMGHVYVDVSGNNVDNASITGYDGNNTINFSIGNDPAGSKKYSIANVISDIVFDRAGEYVVDESAGKIYLWPWDGMDPSALTVTVSVRQEVMQFNASDNIVIDGITFIKSTGKVSYGNGSDGLTIRNCDYHHCRSAAIDNALDLVNQHNLLVEGCTFWRNARMRGVVARRSGSTLRNCVVRNNTFTKIGRTAVFLYEVNGGEISGNHTVDGRGVHSNAYSCYSDHASTDPCRNVVISSNTALNSNNSLTFYGVDTMLIVNNLFDGTGTDWPVSCWNSANSLNVTILHNNFVNSGTARCGFFVLPEGTAQMPTAVIKNNIIDGMRNLGADIGYNLYTMMAVGQVNGMPGDAVNMNKAAIFTDWAGGDWSLLAGSPAIDAGTDMGVTEDVNGTARPKGSAPDKGCFEYDPAAIGDVVTGQGLELGGLVIPNPVRAIAGAVIINRAVLEHGDGAVRLYTLTGQPVENIAGLHTGYYLLRHGDGMRRIVITD